MLRCLIAAVVGACSLLAARQVSARAQAIAPPTVTVPILMYHHVGDAALEKPRAVGARYDISIADFDAQMSYLAQHVCTPVSIEQSATALDGGSPLPERPVAITFDDANQDNFDNAFPILQKHNLFATFCIVTRWVGTPGHLTWDEIATMRQAGMRFGAHSLTHPWLTRLRPVDALREVVDSKVELESHLGEPVTVFAYPYGSASPAILKLVQDAGYAAVLGTSLPRLIHTSAQRFYLTRLGIYRGITLASFAARLTIISRITPADHASRFTCRSLDD